jgi:quinol monooxygenase YgiN
MTGGTMTKDTSVSFHPYFKVHGGKLDAFRDLCRRFIEKTRTETGCLYYGFTFHEDEVYCREAYVDAGALLTHTENVGALIQEALTIADLIRLEAHGPEEELAKLREPFADLKPQYFAIYDSFHS